MTDAECDEIGLKNWHAWALLVAGCAWIVFLVLLAVAP